MKRPLLGLALLLLLALSVAWALALSNWHGVLVGSALILLLAEVMARRSGLFVVSSAQSSALFAALFVALATTVWLLGRPIGALILAVLATYLVARLAVSLRAGGWSGKDDDHRDPEAL